MNTEFRRLEFINIFFPKNDSPWKLITLIDCVGCGFFENDYLRPTTLCRVWTIGAFRARCTDLVCSRWPHVARIWGSSGSGCSWNCHGNILFLTAPIRWTMLIKYIKERGGGKKTPAASHRTSRKINNFSGKCRTLVEMCSNGCSLHWKQTSKLNSLHLWKGLKSRMLPVGIFFKYFFLSLNLS